MTYAAAFTSHRQTWRTPTALYRRLDDEFRFTLDPCPPDDRSGYDGLLASWEGERVFCNPPYSQVRGWIEKCHTESVSCGCVVALVPARTDTGWFHDYCLCASEVRFIRGRLRFDDGPGSAPFPSMIVVWL